MADATTAPITTSPGTTTPESPADAARNIVRGVLLQLGQANAHLTLLHSQLLSDIHSSETITEIEHGLRKITALSNSVHRNVQNSKECIKPLDLQVIAHEPSV